MPRTTRLIINDEAAVYHAWDVEPNNIYRPANEARLLSHEVHVDPYRDLPLSDQPFGFEALHEFGRFHLLPCLIHLGVKSTFDLSCSC